MFKKLLAVAVVAFSLGALAQGKVQIEFWSWYLSPKFDPFLDGVAKDFEAKYPNITVKRVDKQDTMERDLQAQIALGQAPDVVNLWLDATFSAVQAGLLRPTTEFTPLAQLKQIYFSNILDMYTINGQVYGFPWYGYVDQGVMMYNSELVAKAGVDTARIKTTSDLLEASKVVKQKTGSYGWLPPVKDPNGASFLGQFFLEGLPIYDKDGKAAFNSDAHVKLLQKFVDLMKADVIPQDLLRKEAFQLTNELYSQGKAAFIVGGPQSLTRVKDSNKDIYGKTKIVDAPLGAAKVQTGGAFTLVIPKASKNPKEAALFALFLSNKTNQAKFANVVPIVPTSIGSSLDPILQPKAKSTDPIDIATSKVAGAGNLIKAGFTPPKSTEAVYKNFNDNIEAAFLGKKTPKQALDDAVAFWNDNAK